ncbi:MAG: AmmeMemoRadiSam system protein B, partial [bacterium]
MRFFIFSLFFILITISPYHLPLLSAQIRPPVVAGKFYPADPAELKKAVDSYLKNAPEPPKFPGPVLCLLVPHAGYDFSAPIAAAGYKSLATKYSTVVIIGAAHAIPVKGAAIYPSGEFLTPLGRVKVDTGLAKKLLKESPLFEDNRRAHAGEHSVEVQLPFLQRKLEEGFKILPIVMNTDDFETAIKI